MATEADLIQKFKDLNIPVGSDFEELIHEAFVGANLVDKVDNHDSRIATVENNLSATKGSIQSNANAIEKNANAIKNNTSNITTKADDSKVVHNSGTEEIGGQKTFDNAPIDKATGTPYSTKSDVTTAISAATANMADDSKVAHLSGANNFDTVPTVNNNPLLLASSLPSDLARTSQQTNFTAGLKSGGVDVATAADLKSIEDSAWHEVSLPDSTILKNAHFMYRSELIDAHYNIPFILTGTVIVPTVKSSDGVILLDLSSYLPIPKDDYKNYTVNSAILGPSDKSFNESDNDVFNPSYDLGERYLRIKFVNSDLVLYSTSGFAYFRTVASSGVNILLVMSSDLKSLPTIHFVPSTKI